MKLAGTAAGVHPAGFSVLEAGGRVAYDGEGQTSIRWSAETGGEKRLYTRGI